MDTINPVDMTNTINQTEMVNTINNNGGTKMINPTVKTTLRIVGMNLIGGMAAGAGMMLGNIVAGKIYSEARKTPEQRAAERAERKERRQERRQSRKAKKEAKYYETTVETENQNN